MIVLASHQCGPGSNPGVDAICGLSLLLVLFFAPRGFSPGTPLFPSPLLREVFSPGTPVFPSPLLREVFLRVLRFSPLLCSERFFSGCSGFPLSFAPRGFSPGAPVFPSPLLRGVFLRVLRFSPLLCSEGFFSGCSGFPLYLNNQHFNIPIRPGIRNQVDEEPLRGCATSKSLFIHLFIYLEQVDF